MDLIDALIKNGWLKTPEIIEAFKKIKREDFLPEDLKYLAESNEALPIGYGQTISQPLVVAFRLDNSSFSSNCWRKRKSYSNGDNSRIS